jgi:penicillin-binding protein 2
MASSCHYAATAVTGSAATTAAATGSTTTAAATGPATPQVPPLLIILHPLLQPPGRLRLTPLPHYAATAAAAATGSTAITAAATGSAATAAATGSSAATAATAATAGAIGFDARVVGVGTVGG